MLTITNVKQGSPEWHKLRAGKVTASNASILLYKGKLSAIEQNKPGFSGYWAQRGHILEEEAISIYEKVFKSNVIRYGFVQNSLYPDCGWSPDGLVILPDKRIGIEVKAFKEDKHINSIKTLPPEVIAQCQFGIMIGELDYMDVVLYNPDLDDTGLCFKTIKIYPDKLIIKRFIDKLGLDNG